MLESKCLYEVKDFSEILKNKKKYAKEFSEGDSSLENVLKLLWNESFETIGCCAGHPDKKMKPYVGIKIKNAKKTIDILSSLDKNDIHITFVSFKGVNNFCIRKNKEKNIFENILQSYNKKNIKEDELLKSIINKILNRESDEYLNIHCLYNDNKYPKIYINTTDLNLIKDYKTKYEYKILNKKICLYRFKIN